MTKEIRGPNFESSQLCGRRIRHSDFVIPSDFVIRHSDLIDSSVPTVAARIRRWAPATRAPGGCAAARNGPGCTSGIFLPRRSKFPPALRKDAAVLPPPPRPSPKRADRAAPRVAPATIEKSWRKTLRLLQEQ